MLWSASAVSASEGSVSVSDAPERADVAPGRNRGVSTHAPPRRLGSVAGRRALMALPRMLWSAPAVSASEGSVSVSDAPIYLCRVRHVTTG